MSQLNILDAISDSKVFASAFRNRETWTGWFAFLAALFGLRMDASMRALFRECTGRNDRPSEQASEAWLVIGRRGGKSFVLALIAVFLATFREKSTAEKFNGVLLEDPRPIPERLQAVRVLTYMQARSFLKAPDED